MTTYYVSDELGDDSWDGTSPTFTSGTTGPKATLNGAEDIPVVAGDKVWVHRGVYREELTLDVSGSAGNEIVYEGDVLGQNWDEGGVVRITGSDDDTTATRATCITDAFVARNYRTFRGFRLDMSTTRSILLVGDSCTIEDCLFGETAGNHLRTFGAGQANLTVRRCFFGGTGNFKIALYIQHNTTVDDTGHLIENCLFSGEVTALRSDRVGGITFKNNLCYSLSTGVNVAVALAGGQTITVNNNIIAAGNNGLTATATGEITEDFNALWSLATARTNVSVGANSNTYPPLLAMPLLFDEFKMPWWFGELSEWSQIAAIAGSGESTDDFFGLDRPTTSAKKSWGPIQFADVERETTTVRTGSSAIVFNDSGRKQFFVPVTNVSTTFSVWVYREGDYAGTNPQMVIKQPGQADTIVTDVGADSQWNELTTTLTPDASTDFVIVELVSNNTASHSLYGGSNDVFFDDLMVS